MSRQWKGLAVIGLGLVIAGSGLTQVKTIRIDDFEPDMGSWAAMTFGAAGLQPDGKAKVGLTQEAGKVKSGKHSLAYSYDLEPGHVSVLTLNREMNLAGMTTLHLAVQSQVSTAVLITLGEKNGASYQSSAYLPEGVWQDIAVNLNEFRRDGETQDPNGRLDAEEIHSITLMDVGVFLVNAIADLKGRRTLYLDDVRFGAAPGPVTVGIIKSEAGQSYRVDSFESPVIRWIPVGLQLAPALKFTPFTNPLRIDGSVPPEGGKGSLQLNYTREQGKISALTRSLEKEDLARATTLNAWMKVSRDGMIVWSLEEKDGSRYQQMVDAKTGDGWKQLTFPLAGFTLADDSQDENGRLDPGQLKDLGLMDPAGIFGADVGQAMTLWLDEISFSLGN